jgi:hypothetical protein
MAMDGDWGGWIPHRTKLLRQFAFRIELAGKNETPVRCRFQFVAQFVARFFDYPAPCPRATARDRLVAICA